MAQLIDRLRNVEEQAIEELYQEVFEKFWIYIRARGGSMEDARDIFQEELVRLLEEVHKRDIENVKGYLFRMLTNRWGKSQKKTRIISMDDNPDMLRKLESKQSLHLLEDSESSQLKEAQLVLVDQLLENVKPDEKKILIDYYYKKKPLADIAKEMNLSSSYIRVKKTRMMERFRSRLASFMDP